jgi:hypothetical protein
MLGILKTTRIRNWEMLLLKNALKQLPAEFKKLEEQVDAGLLKDVLTGPGGPDYFTAFTYNRRVLARFKNQAGGDYKITGIKVFDKNSSSQLLYTFYVSSGIINGYSIKGADKYSLDVESVDVSWFIQIFKEPDEYSQVKKGSKSDET